MGEENRSAHATRGGGREARRAARAQRKAVKLPYIRRRLPVVAGAICLTVGLVALYLRTGRTVRTILAAAVGLFATAHGIGVHIAHLAKVEVGGADYTGLLALAAGIVLLLLAIALQLAGRRWPARILVIVVSLLAIEVVVIPVTVGAYATSVPHAPVRSAGSIGVAGAQDVTFPARDGTRLAGWYVPGTNGAAVILMHGSSSTRAATLAHLRMLARNGYGILAFDARGHGESAGQANAFGWRGDDDIAGAVRYLRDRAGVDPGRIAALGLSMGAEEALRAAADGAGLARWSRTGPGHRPPAISASRPTGSRRPSRFRRRGRRCA